MSCRASGCEDNFVLQRRGTALQTTSTPKDFPILLDRHENWVNFRSRYGGWNGRTSDFGFNRLFGQLYQSRVLVMRKPRRRENDRGNKHINPKGSTYRSPVGFGYFQEESLEQPAGGS
jgi:hypothetical protein